MVTRNKWFTGSMVSTAIVVFAILAFLFTLGGETRCAQAQASCGVGDDETLAGDLILQSGTAFDLTQSHAITANRAIAWGDFAGEPVLVNATQAVSAKTITASALDSSPIGATTPSTGAFTTVTVGTRIDGTTANGFLDLFGDSGAGIEMRLTDGGLWFLNDTINTDMTVGLTINQGSVDNEIFALKNADVAHSMTDITETDTFGQMVKVAALGGGLLIRGIRDSGHTPNKALMFHGLLDEAADSGSIASSDGVVQITGFITDGGTNITAVAAAGNVLAIENNATTLHLTKGDGSTVQFGQGGYFQGSDPGGVTDVAHVYAKDVTASAEIFVRDEAGNVTQISPHDPTTNHWYFNSCNEFSGRCLRIDMEAALMALGSLTGQTLVTETFIPISDRLDWDTVERGKEAAALAAIGIWDNEGARPDPYTPRPKPAWLTD